MPRERVALPHGGDPRRWPSGNRRGGATPRMFGKRLQLRKVASPRRVHHASDAVQVPAGGQPVADALRRGVVVAGQHLDVTAVGEKRQALGRLAAVPVDDDHVLRQALPRPREVAVDEVEVLHGIVRRIEHVTPDAQPGLGVDPADDLAAAAHVSRQLLARRASRLPFGLAPTGHADLVVAEEIGVRPEQFLDAANLILDDLEHFRFAERAGHLAIVDRHGVVVADVQTLTVANPRAGQ